MKLQTESAASEPQACDGDVDARGAGVAIACASAMPLVVLALAVGADYGKVARFRHEVQLAADAASVAAAAARRPDGLAADDAGALARQVGARVFKRDAPAGAIGAPAIATLSQAAEVTASVGYHGVAPSNFGAIFGYGAISVSASATLPTLATSRPPGSP